jgi:two-component system chemotaxis sensor kinase CheA
MSDAQRARYVALFAAEARTLLALGRRTVAAWQREPAEPAHGAELFRVLHTIKGMAASLAFEELADQVHDGETALARVREGERTADADWFAEAEHLLDALTARCEAEIVREGGPVAAASTGALGVTRGGEVVRVEQGRLDALVADLGGLVTARQELERRAAADAISPVARAALAMARRLDIVQERILQVRMAPLSEILERIPPLVRDLARQLGKDVTIDVQGEALEVDRGILSLLPDPLLHLLRNAVDHGIESPAVRRAAGKRAAGRITLVARHDRDAILVELTDDGAGIDREAIAARERAAGRLDPGAALTDDGLLAILARPGFSTAAALTDVSGRGVGLDAVLSRLHQVGASLSLSTVPGRGTAFTLRLPMRLGIVRALVAGVGGERYVLPLTHVAELVAWDASAARHVEGRLMMPLREEIVPVLDLRRLLGHRGSPPPTHRPAILLEANGQRVALLSDRILGQVDAVVQPVDRPKGMPRWITGATVLDDGRPALMLDLASVV